MTRSPGLVPVGSLIEATLQELRARDEGHGQLAYVTELPAVAARYAEPTHPLSGRFQRYLQESGLQLYTHQAAAFDHVMEGRNVVLATPTASGKTLAFNLPVLTLLERDPDATALYVYPTKALANDQLRALGDVQAATGLEVGAAVYDSDTPPTRKREILRTSRLVITNPHGLHWYLAHHHNWKRIWSNLAVVVIDEAHHYRGVLGSNVALLLRRLWRVLRSYRSDPQVMLASGTIANPSEHASKLTGKHCEVVDDVGAPRGPKYFAIWNPHLPDRPGERSTHFDAAALLAFLTRQGHQTLCFSASRAAAELTARWAQERAPDRRIVAYRAGYQPQERRSIEQGLKTGELDGVASTNALELGVDVGSLDAVVLTGYPGTIMSTWQQAGRAGRATQPALVVLVAFEDPLDQYLAANPKRLLDEPPEHAVVDLDNEHIVAGHVLCAARELAVTDADEAVFGDHLQRALEHWEHKELVTRRQGGWRTRSGVWPPARVPLDATDEGAITVGVDGKPLEVMSQRRAVTTAHPGAILLNKGEVYVVTDLDLQRQQASARPTTATYYTEAMVSAELEVEETTATRPLPAGKLHLGRVTVTDVVTGYRQLRYDKPTGLCYLDLPPVTFSTVALWYTPTEEVQAAVRAAHRDWLGALHAAEHALIHMLPLYAMCDPRDAGGMSVTHHPDTGRATLFVYDGHPGGIGLTAKAFTLFEQLAATTYEMVSHCGCEDGCPACVYDRRCGNANGRLDKHAALIILDRLRRLANHGE